MKPIRETLQDVVRLFKSYPSDKIAIETKRALKDAAKEIETLLAATDLSDDKLREKTDLIIAGAIIYAMAIDDNKYNRPGLHYCDRHMYSRTPKQVFEQFTEEMSFLDKLNHLGHRALIAQDLPFTGIFNQTTFGNGVFKPLNQPLKGHFDSYKLKAGKDTMDPTALNKPGKDKRAKDQADNKWKKPFGLDVDNQLTDDTRSEFSQKRGKIVKAIKAQDSRYTTELWKWRGLVALAWILFPITLVTSYYSIPWLRNKRAAIQSEYDNRPWRKATFTREEYDNIRSQRRSLKETFTDTEKPGKNPKKPHKVCAGVDKHGKFTENMEEITKVVMLGDKNQLERWSPRFLKTATQATYNESIEASVSLGQP